MQRGKLLFVILIAAIFGISLRPQHVQAAASPAPRVFYFYYQFAPDDQRPWNQVDPTKWVGAWQDGSAYQHSLIGTSTVDGTTRNIVTPASDGQNVFISDKGSSRGLSAIKSGGMSISRSLLRHRLCLKALSGAILNQSFDTPQQSAGEFHFDYPVRQTLLFRNRLSITDFPTQIFQPRFACV